MKVRGLDNREYTWQTAGHVVPHTDLRPRSNLHLQCRGLLHAMFPALMICEEVPLPGSGNLTLDFYLPQLRLAVEVNGPQHYGMNSRFHASRRDYFEQRRRDANKGEWCRLNNVRLVVLCHADDSDRWRRQIQDS